MTNKKKTGKKKSGKKKSGDQQTVETSSEIEVFNENDIQGNFLALISHEIRTPLQSVFSLLELIADEQPDKKILSMVDTAKESAGHMLSMLDGILDFAKIDAEKMILDNFEVPVRTLVQGVIEALEVKTKTKDVKLSANIDDDVPFIIMGDPQRLRQILINLTSNAIKFTDEGQIEIHVTTQATKIKPEDGQIGLRFEVIDSGIGIEEEIQKILFQPFTQAENSTSRKYGGTGLGLSICKRLVELMNGAIGVESAENKGSNFWFEIPSKTISLDDDLQELPDLDGLSILSVEDHPQGAYEIKRSLESMGAKVLSCQTYEDGLEAAISTPFDVALIDQGLPDGLGLDLIKEISEHNPYLGMIMYTARDDSGMQMALKSYGIPYLSKPASRVGLGLAVEDASRKTVSIQQSRVKRVLVAEDTASVQDVLSRQFSKLDIDVDFVENGKEALKLMQEKDYGVLITDLHMPIMNGYDLVHTIREEEKESDTTIDQRLPVILLTADIQVSERQNYQDKGFDECMIKPVSIGQIKHLLIRWGVLQKEENDKSIEQTPIAKTNEQKETPVTHNNTESGAIIDTKAIERLMGSFDQDALQMLDIFVQMTPDLILKMREEAVNLDFIALEQSAHSLKGGAKSACCPELSNLAGEIQNLARHNNEKAIELCQQLDHELGRIKEELERIKTDVT